jgi:DnaJ-class molecular chaperone
MKITNKQKECTTCNGTGVDPKRKNRICPVCKGTTVLVDDIIL